MMNPVSALILGLYGPYGGMHARLLAWLPCGSNLPVVISTEVEIATQSPTTRLIRAAA
jgi:hypothetical protein